MNSLEVDVMKICVNELENLNRAMEEAFRQATDVLADDKLVRDMEVSGAAAMVMSGCPENIDPSVSEMVGEASLIASEVLKEE